MSDFNVLFHTRKEAARVPLSEKEMSLLPLADLVQKICWALIIGFPLAFGGYALYATLHPAWKLDSASLGMYQEKILRHKQMRNAYVSAVERVNSRIRMDRVAAPILSPAPKGIFLESVNYRTEYRGSRVRGVLLIKGHSTEPDPKKVEEYLVALNQSIQQSVPDFRVNLLMEEHAVDSKSGNLQFTFSGAIQ